MNQLPLVDVPFRHGFQNVKNQFVRPLLYAAVSAGFGFILARALFVGGEKSLATGGIERPDGGTGELRNPMQVVEGERRAKPSAEELHAALAGEDVFRAAPVALAWLEQATIEELRAFLQDAKRFPRDYVVGFDGEFKRLFFDRLLERWQALEPVGIQTLAAPDMGGLEWQETVARARPNEYLEMSLGQPVEKQSPRLIEAAFASLAGKNQSEAREFLQKLPTKDQRKKAEAAMIKGLAKQDVFAAAALVKPWNNEERDIDALFAVGDLLWEAELAGPGVLRRVLAESGGKLDAFVTATEMRFRYPEIAEDLAERGQRGVGNTTESSTWALPGGLRTGEGVSPERRAKILGNIEQLPASERTSRVPPWSSTILCAIERPRPLPGIAWLCASEERKNRSKSRCCSLAGTPMPVSATSSTA